MFHIHASRGIRATLALLLIGTTLSFNPAHAAQWSGNTRVELIQVIDNLEIIRVGITSSFNPAACLNTNYVDFRIGEDDRTPAELRQLLDILNISMVTGRTINVLILDDLDTDNCSTIGTGASIRVGAGIRVFR